MRPAFPYQPYCCWQRARSKRVAWCQSSRCVSLVLTQYQLPNNVQCSHCATRHDAFLSVNVKQYSQNHPAWLQVLNAAAIYAAGAAQNQLPCPPATAVHEFQAAASCIFWQRAMTLALSTRRRAAVSQRLTLMTGSNCKPTPYYQYLLGTSSQQVSMCNFTEQSIIKLVMAEIIGRSFPDTIAGSKGPDSLCLLNKG
eukprot:GHRR01035754.1.p1 GENE.GHRR01035754.1~~GHRR01035754.1.p1  ORF type:complete len:197 (-),score=24.06 GHRR01035754.1:121-711(-)